MVAALLLLLTHPLQAAPAMEGSWWVVLGASLAPDKYHAGFQDRQPNWRRRARRCGMQTTGDFAAKFEGFAPSLYVTAVSGFTTRSEAEAALIRVRPCVPDASLRQGGYAGE